MKNARQMPNRYLGYFDNDYDDAAFYGQQGLYQAGHLDDEGFARVDEILLDPPDSGDYVTAVVAWNSSGQEEVPLRFPFDRYYLDEYKAPEAERAYWNSLQRATHPTYITVRVRKGFGVIEGLFIDNTPLNEYLERPPQ